jgi:hypothetical protein
MDGPLNTAATNTERGAQENAATTTTYIAAVRDGYMYKLNVTFTHICQNRSPVGLVLTVHLSRSKIGMDKGMHVYRRE